MKRKLIQLSPTTCVCSIPAKWMKTNKLSKGDEVELEEVDNRIIISSKKEKTRTSTEVDLSQIKYGKLVYAKIESTYIAGYDKITFTHREDQQKKLQVTAKEMPGMLIAEQTPTKIVFQDITGNNQEDIDKIINRIFNMIISLIQDGEKATQNKDWKTLKDIKQRDYVINSYISYCHRQINKFGYVVFSKIGLLTSFLKLNEMVSDEMCSVLEEIGHKKRKSNESFPDIEKFYKLLQRIHHKYEEDKVSNLEKLRLKIKDARLKDLLFDLIETEIQFQS